MCRGCRIIPARAGFTRPDNNGRPREWDHPRSRGVYSVRYSVPEKMTGSSPLARGLLKDTRAGLTRRGIIPARAGFTLIPIKYLGYMRDHPRSRGVYARPAMVTRYMYGSSPLARGLPGKRVSKNPVSRIIPARAGFTFRLGIWGR